MDNSAVSISKDSVSFTPAEWMGPEGKEDYIMQLLYSVDSLQDSIKLKDVQLAYTKVLDNQKIDIPFSITKTESKFPKDGMNLIK
jgi:hypothetical protein